MDRVREIARDAIVIYFDPIFSLFNIKPSINNLFELAIKSIILILVLSIFIHYVGIIYDTHLEFSHQAIVDLLSATHKYSNKILEFSVIVAVLCFSISVIIYIRVFMRIIFSFAANLVVLIVLFVIFLITLFTFASLVPPLP